MKLHRLGQAGLLEQVKLNRLPSKSPRGVHCDPERPCEWDRRQEMRLEPGVVPRV